jgi:hypothetical protein
LTGQDTIFNNHLIGELKTRKINPSTRNAPIKPITEFSTAGFENVIFIHNE